MCVCVYRVDSAFFTFYEKLNWPFCRWVVRSVVHSFVRALFIYNKQLWLLFLLLFCFCNLLNISYIFNNQTQVVNDRVYIYIYICNSPYIHMYIVCMCLYNCCDCVRVHKFYYFSYCSVCCCCFWLCCWCCFYLPIFFCGDLKTRMAKRDYSYL